MHVFSAAWLTTLATTAIVTVALCVVARRRPGLGATVVNAVLAAVLLGTSAVFIVEGLVGKHRSMATSLPLALCDAATVVAAFALLTRVRVLVELTWFWGLAGTLQALLTPDQAEPFPSLQFFEYVLAHSGIVCTAVVLVVAERIHPARRAVPRVFLISLGYTAFVGLADWWTGGNYMYLRAKPGNWTLLSALGPWPWYVASAAGVAIVLFTLLDLPFWRERTRPPARLEGELRGRRGGMGPREQSGGRVRGHAGPEDELPPATVGNPAELGELVALLAPERGSSPADDGAGAGLVEEGPRDVPGATELP